jgi:hypothetical protein
VFDCGTVRHRHPRLHTIAQTQNIAEGCMLFACFLFFSLAIGRLFGGTPPFALDAFVSMLAQRQTHF